MMEKAFYLISPFLLLEEQFSVCDHPCSASSPPSCRAHHTSQVKWDSRALWEGQTRFLTQHWIRKHLQKWGRGRVNQEQRVGTIRGRKRNPICIGINEKYALTFIPIWNMELNITNYRLWVYVSFIIVITINAMISNLKGHYVCLIYFLGKLSISFPSEDLLSGLLVTCPHWHKLGPASLWVWELPRFLSFWSLPGIFSQLYPHSMLQSTMGPTSIRSWHNAEILMVAWGGVKSRDAEKRLNSNGITLCHKMPKCVSILTFCVCVLGPGNRDNLSPYMTMSSLYSHIRTNINMGTHFFFCLVLCDFNLREWEWASGGGLGGGLLREDIAPLPTPSIIH